MIFLIVDIEQIEELNKLSKKHQIQAIKYEGHWVVGADLLTDEKSFGHAFEYLKTCEEIILKK